MLVQTFLLRDDGLLLTVSPNQQGEAVDRVVRVYSFLFVVVIWCLAVGEWNELGLQMNLLKGVRMGYQVSVSSRLFQISFILLLFSNMHESTYLK